MRLSEYSFEGLLDRYECYIVKSVKYPNTESHIIEREKVKKEILKRFNIYKTAAGNDVKVIKKTTMSHIPKNCLECNDPFCKVPTTGEKIPKKYQEKRPSNCPLVEI